MIEVDGGYGEGGGQILRSSLTFSAITGKETRIRGIRVKRPNPGLRAQHLAAVKATSIITSGRLEGAKIGSTEIIFKPGKIKGGRYEFDIGTAGSITLLLQTLIPILIFSNAESYLEVRGGTDVKWSPSIDYFKMLFLELLERRGIRARCEVIRRGYYPKGGGLVRAEVLPSVPRALNFEDRGREKRIWGRLHSNLHEEITKRLIRSIEGIEIDEERSNAISPGIGITLFAEYKRSTLGSCALGERGVRAEKVGRKCQEKLKEEMSSKATLDVHAMDQLIPYISLFGGVAKARELSRHASTNIYVAERFLEKVFKVEGSSEGVIISSKGARL